MALTIYCTPDEVRAALGVSDEELSDAVVNLPIYMIGMTRELNKISPSLPALFTAAAAVSEENRTENQAAIYDATRLFVTYAVAKMVGVSLPGFMLKDVGDGKASFSRFTDAAAATMAGITSAYLTALAALAATVALVTAVPVTERTFRPLLAVVGRSYDPVTDGG